MFHLSELSEGGHYTDVAALFNVALGHQVPSAVLLQQVARLCLGFTIPQHSLVFPSVPLDVPSRPAALPNRNPSPPSCADPLVASLNSQRRQVEAPVQESHPVGHFDVQGVLLLYQFVAEADYRQKEDRGEIREWGLYLRLYFCWK